MKRVVIVLAVFTYVSPALVDAAGFRSRIDTKRSCGTQRYLVDVKSGDPSHSYEVTVENESLGSPRREATVHVPAGGTGHTGWCIEAMYLKPQITGEELSK